MKPEDVAASWSTFVRNVVGDLDLSNKEIAERITDVSDLTISDSTVGNWMRNENFSQPTGSNVVAFARAFGVSLPKALVAAGYGEARDYSETIVVRRDYREMTVKELFDSIELILARIRDVAENARPDPPPPNGRARKRRIRLQPREDMPPL